MIRKSFIRKNSLFTACLIIISVFLSSCNRPPFYQKDISGIEPPEVSIHRYEVLLFTANPFELAGTLQPRAAEFEVFLGESLHDPAAVSQLYEYVTDPLLKEIYLDVMDAIHELSDLEAGLQQAFRYLLYHFPEIRLPGVYTYISGLDYHHPVHYTGNELLIAIDMYLGADYPNYSRIGMPAYLIRRTEPSFMLPDAMRTIGWQLIARQAQPPETLLDHMIFEGKLLYFLDATLPQLHDTLKIGYTNGQLSWMQSNMGAVWSYYLENELLFSSDHMMINKFIGEAPFTSTFSSESAPRTAAWLGWNIVRQYMKRNPDVDLGTLFRNADSVKILQESRFRPA